MRPLADLSDAELEAIANGDTTAFARATAQRHGVRPELVGAVIHQESRGNQAAVSPKGARGRMQLMPNTAKELGVDPDDEFQNIEGGVRYLSQQIKDFGDERTALAAYNAGPGAVRRYGGVPPYAETQGYVEAIQGASPDIRSASDEELMRIAGEAPAPRPAKGNSTPAGRGYANPADIAALATKKPKDQSLGMAESVAHVGRRLAAYSPANLIPGFREKNAASLDRLDTKIAERKETRSPGALGRFAGDVAIAGGLTGPLSPLLGGAVSGAALSDAQDAKGTLKDAAFGAVTSRLAAAGSDALQIGLRKVLSKAPNVLKPAELPRAVKEAYDAVDASGFRFGKRQVAGLADDFTKTMGSTALSKTAKDDARSIIAYTRQLSKGDLTLAQLEKLRGDIYTSMVQKGGDTGRLGVQFRQQIDAMIDAVDDGTVRNARALNARLKKADVVTRASKSADRAAEKDYGGDYGRKLKDRLNPLVDEMKPNRNLRGGTSDEMAAIDRIVRGTKGQNFASTAGGMLDPRRLGGKILSTITTTGGGASAPLSGGLSLLVPTAQIGAGFALTGTASKIARNNLDDLIKLIAAGGSRQVLAPVPTKASAATEKAIARVLRPAAVISSVPASAAARSKKRRDR